MLKPGVGICEFPFEERASLAQAVGLIILNKPQILESTFSGTVPVHVLYPFLVYAISVSPAARATIWAHFSHLSFLAFHTFLGISTKDVIFFPPCSHLSLLDKCHPKLLAFSTLTTKATLLSQEAPVALLVSDKFPILLGVPWMEILITRTLCPPQLLSLASVMTLWF